MAVDNFNSIGGFSSGIPPIQVIDSNGNVITNVLTNGNVTANVVYAAYYRFANGTPISLSPGGSNTQLQFNSNGVFGGISNVTWDGNALSLGNVANIRITGGNTGQILSTNGSGNLSWVNGPPAIPAGSNNQIQFNNNGALGAAAGFTFDSLTNILSAPGKIDAVSIAVSDAIVYGNIATINVEASGNITAASFIGNGASLTNINAETAGFVTQPNQSNITSVGTLSSLNASGNIVSGSFISAANFQTTGNVSAGNITATGLANIASGITAGGNINFTNTSNISLGNVGNLHITGGLNGYALVTDGLGNLSWSAAGGGGAPGGSNTQIQYNGSGVLAGSSYFTFNDATNTVQIGGNLIANTFQLGSGSYKFGSMFVYFTTTSTMSKSKLYSVPVSDCSGLEFDIIGTDNIGSTRQSIKISSLYYSGIVQYSEYGGVYINGSVGSFSVEYNPGDIINPPSIDLYVVPDTSNQVVYKMWITVLAP